MTDDSVTVPDFVPASIEVQYQEMARQQVRGSRSPLAVPPPPDPVTPQDVAVQARAPTQKVTAFGSTSRWLDRLSGAQIALATAAAVLGLLGLAALTTFWAWLAMSEDPMWWAFTAMGFVVSLGLALAVATLNQHAQKLTPAGVPPSD